MSVEKNIIFLSLVKFDNINDRGIYPDLLRQFIKEGHNVTIVCPLERKYKLNSNLINQGNLKILQVRTLNIQKCNLIEKGISTLSINYLFKQRIKLSLKKIEFDIILYATPPITFFSLVKWLKNISGAKSYLLLKDIFPQNAVDIGLLRQNSIIHRYFKYIEKKLYEISDFIGCMSPANLAYLLENNPEIENEKLEVNPNSIEVEGNCLGFETDLYIKYGIPKNRVIFIFGGNLGLPQGIDYLKANIEFCKSIKEAFFLIVGNGTEYNNLSNWIQAEGTQNALLIKELPKSEYEEIIRLSHVGLIYLNPLFTIPNFPSRILSYMQNNLPVICATDLSTDIGDIALKNNFGLKCRTNDSQAFFDCVVKLLDNNLRVEMGKSGFDFLCNEYTVVNSYNKIIAKL